MLLSDHIEIDIHFCLLPTFDNPKIPIKNLLNLLKVSEGGLIRE